MGGQPRHWLCHDEAAEHSVLVGMLLDYMNLSVKASWRNVAILDGITMGGGGGVSIPGTFRVATDRTVFATPEVHIGFHPDAAASFYLSHLTGHVGEYVALTGEKLNGTDMIALGLATHYFMSGHLDLIDERLAKLVTDDPSVIDSSLAQYGDMVYPDKKSIVHRLEVIDKCFSHDTVEEIVDALVSTD
uniref:3-hydroxyisobutyryl-CoA hydrolase n=1 Tax=Zea mays TaxID=4577 RepID=C0P9K0_MAIZE|nr:unknown [Zea mays]|eukprot:NP_001168845.1 uncharacterized protein LOC100382650 [Zea mays]